MDAQWHESVKALVADFITPLDTTEETAHWRFPGHVIWKLQRALFEERYGDAINELLCDVQVYRIPVTEPEVEALRRLARLAAPDWCDDDSTAGLHVGTPCPYPLGTSMDVEEFFEVGEELLGAYVPQIPPGDRKLLTMPLGGRDMSYALECFVFLLLRHEIALWHGERFILRSLLEYDQAKVDVVQAACQVALRGELEIATPEPFATDVSHSSRDVHWHYVQVLHDFVVWLRVARFHVSRRFATFEAARSHLDAIIRSALARASDRDTAIADSGWDDIRDECTFVHSRDGKEGWTVVSCRLCDVDAVNWIKDYQQGQTDLLVLPPRFDEI